MDFPRNSIRPPKKPSLSLRPTITIPFQRTIIQIRFVSSLFKCSSPCIWRLCVSPNAPESIMLEICVCVIIPMDLCELDCWNDGTISHHHSKPFVECAHRNWACVCVCVAIYKRKSLIEHCLISTTIHLIFWKLINTFDRHKWLCISVRTCTHTHTAHQQKISVHPKRVYANMYEHQAP